MIKIISLPWTWVEYIVGQELATHSPAQPLDFETSKNLFSSPIGSKPKIEKYTIEEDFFYIFAQFGKFSVNCKLVV